ncbi:hypothetical protein [Metabacillus sp. FJAT-52054]|uniref:Uncharacterized protein n=1 Tax=Metabacillus sediminis TaxID=3117746 RepID=A0ABZ2NHK4_9BACI
MKDCLKALPSAIIGKPGNAAIVSGFLFSIKDYELFFTHKWLVIGAKGLRFHRRKAIGRLSALPAEIGKKSSQSQMTEAA